MKPRVDGMRRHPHFYTAHWLLSRGIRAVWEVPAELSALALSRRTQIDNLDVFLFGLVPQNVVACLSSTLEIIRTITPRQYIRLRGLVGRILVSDVPSSAYLPLTNTVLIRASACTDAVTAALSIIHEVAHARIRRFGAWNDPRSRARVERICIGEQLDFLSILKERGYQGVDAWVEFLTNQSTSES